MPDETRSPDVPPPARRVPWLRVLAAAVAMLVLAEGGARWLGTRLEAPAAWGDTAQEVKAAQMDALGRDGCVDVVVAGNSMVRDAVVPSVVTGEFDGVSAYNAALDAATPELVGPWVRDQVLGRLDPEVVVVGVASFDLNEQSPVGRAARDAYAGSLQGRSGPLASLERWAADRFALVEHRAVLRDPGAVGSALTDPAEDPEPVATEDGRPVIEGVLGPDGEGRSRRDLHDAGPTSPAARFARSQLLADFALGGDPAGQVGELVEAIRSGPGDPTVVVLVLPTTDGFADLHPGGANQQLAAESAIVEGARRAGAPLLDLRDLPLPDDAFADTHHLNGIGAEEVSRALAAQLPGLVGGVPHCGRRR